MFGGKWFESVLNIQFYCFLSLFTILILYHDALILVGNNLSGSVPSELFALPNIRSGTQLSDKGIDVGKWIW